MAEQVREGRCGAYGGVRAGGLRHAWGLSLDSARMCLSGVSGGCLLFFERGRVESVSLQSAGLLRSTVAERASREEPMQCRSTSFCDRIEKDRPLLYKSHVE